MDNPTPFIISSVNIRSITSKKRELLAYLHAKCVSILCINETFLKPNMPFSVSGFNIERKDRANERGGGVACLLRQDIDYEIIDAPQQFQDLEQMTIQIKTPTGETIVICAIYNPPRNNLPVDFLKYLSSTYRSLLIIGDLNATATWCGSNTTNGNGRLLTTLLDESDLIPLNVLDPSPTHFASRTDTAESVIDWALASPRAERSITHFEVDDDPEIASDHMPIACTLQTKHDEQQNGVDEAQRYVYYRADWNLYAETLNASIDQLIDRDIQSIEELSAANLELATAIIQAANTAIPQQQTRQPRKWWRFSPEMMNHKKCRNRHLRLSRSENPAVRAHHRALANYHEREKARLIREAKARDWKKFCSNLDNIANSKNFHQTFKIFKTARLQPKANIEPICWNGVRASEPREKANLCADYLSAVLQPPAHDNFRQDILEEINNRLSAVPNLMNPSNHATAPESNNPVEQNITEIEIANVLKSSNKRSAPGPDRIQFILLANGPHSLLKMLAKLYNASFDFGFLPEAWKTANILMIPKSGKRQNTPKNMRPISLLNTIGKCMEKVMANRLRIFCEANDLLGPEQSGFRRGRSTNDHLLRFSAAACRAIQEKKALVAVFLDIEKAFDHVWHNGLRFRLIHYRLPKRNIRWISNFLENRRLQVKHDGYISHNIYPTAGVPQGSALSPILFAMFVNDMLPRRNPQLQAGQFADDTSLWTIGEANAPRIIQAALNSIAAWCRKWRMTINADKSQLIVISRKPSLRNAIKLHQLTLNNTALLYQDTATLLGVTFDNYMNMTNHITKVNNRAKAMAMLLKAFQGPTWMTDWHSLLNIYKSHIRPVMTYGACTLLVASECNKKKLQVTQNIALRNALNLPPGVRNSTIHSITKMDLIYDHIQKLAEKHLKSAANVPIIRQMVEEFLATPANQRMRIKRSPLDMLIPIIYPQV